MTSELRIGLVGGGRLAEVGYVPALRAVPGVRLVALAEPDADRRENIADLAGGPAAFPTAADLLAGSGVDGLVLATPVSAHLADARLAAAQGVPVLVEKPPAADRAEAEALAALTPTPWVGFNRRFGPGVAALRAATPPGEHVGLTLELRYRRSGWGAHAVTDDALLDLGPHVIDLARWITRSAVTQIRRATVTPTRAEFDLQLGAARARIRCATDRPHRELIDTRHRDGTRYGRRQQGGLVAAVVGRLVRQRGGHPLAASLAAQVEAFARALRGRPEPTLGTAADGVAVMETIDAVRACARAGDGHTVPVDRR